MIERVKVASLHPHLMLLVNSQDVAAVFESIGVDQDEYYCVWVAIEGGEYTEVWASTNTPRLDAWAWRVL